LRLAPLFLIDRNNDRISNISEAALAHFVTAAESDAGQPAEAIGNGTRREAKH
jgi:hypothetical protein